MIEITQRLSTDEQRLLVDECRDIIAQSPLYELRMRNGYKFHLKCASAGQCGWYSDEQGYRYTRVHPCLATPFPEIPPVIYRIAIEAAASVGETFTPHTALLNWFQEGDSLGLHVDKTEENLIAPVVSISLGTNGLFQIGGVERDDPIRDVILESGDVLVFGREHRLIWHGIKKVFAPLPLFDPTKEIGMKVPGRINITVRQVYD